LVQGEFGTPHRPIPAKDAVAPGVERRQHPRYPDDLRIRYRDLEGSAPSRWGRSRDLSLGGICLLTDREVLPGSHLAIEIHADPQTPPILALGKVVRCAPDGRGHTAGIQFLWVGEEDLRNLRALDDYFRSKHGA